MNSSTHLISGPMKLIQSTIGVLLIGFISSCSTYQPGISTEPDDRYYSLKDAKNEQRAARKLNSTQSSAFVDATNTPQNDISDSDDSYQRITDPNDYTPNNGTTIINNYNSGGFDMDDYYDYMYASRIRRFHRNTASFGYYDPFFTNTYFYNPNPFLFGNSIYSSYGFFNPYVPWGFNNWGGGPGLNIGWNSFSGFYMNFNMGWSNPWMAFNNPWRWNNWGYNPWGSPFGYNPYAYNPWGFGMNSFNNGYMMGYSNALMYNSMMNNGMYYNSFDNNTYNYNTNNVVNNYGNNSPGAGGGSSWKSQSESFSKEFGQSVSAMHTNDVKIQPAVSGQNPVKGGNTTIAPVVNNNNKETQIKPATVQKGKGENVQISSPANDNSKGKGNAVIQASSPTSTEVKGGNNASPQISSPSTNNNQVQDVKGSLSNQTKPNTSVSVGNSQNVSNAQGGKQDLINQGKPSSVPSNYSSAPVKGSQAVKDNSPSVNRPANINPKQFDALVPSSNSVNNTANGNSNSGKAQPYMPKYDYNNGVRSGSLNNAGNSTKSNISRENNLSQPSNSKAPSQNYQNYNAPKQSAPVQNYQRYEAPKQSAPAQNYQRYQAPKQSAPAQNYQRYEAPKQNAPTQNYQRYEAPKQSTPSINNTPKYQAPKQSTPNRGYQAPAPKAPRNSYQTPSRHSAPKQFSAPKNSTQNRSFSTPSRSSSPSMRSSSPKPSSGSKMNSGSKGSSSPRRK